MRVLGIEGTAWCASAALHDTETDTTRIESDAYEPESGGIHPREAAEHMADALPAVVDTIVATATDEYGPDPIDAVAFSRGPGLGACLRTAGTAARALAGTLEVPLVGVNHMVAHAEIGRHLSDFDDPICLNASGANAHLLGYHDGRYRVLGETMDTGVGNAIDKFTRHVGWTHPGGPKVEAAAADATGTELLDLPYVVKGMDFSFSGISTAANAAADRGVPVETICFSLQEHVFAVLTEVSERALSLTGADELVLGGGVGQNARLREMLSSMCAERGARFFAPDGRFLRDNAGMIAVLGAKMATAGDTIPIDESSVDPNFRPDEVPVTWREFDRSTAGAAGRTGAEGVHGDVSRRGAEATIDMCSPAGERADRDGEATEIVDPDGADGECDIDLSGRGPLSPHRLVCKRRVRKSYRHPELDVTVRRNRTVSEARITSEARRAGVPTPLVYDVDVANATLTLQYVGDRDLAVDLSPGRARTVGRYLARIHEAGIVHGDPTTRNVRIADDADRSHRSIGNEADLPSTNTPAHRLLLIDFGLGYHSGHVEDHAMDLHVFEGSLVATTSDPGSLIDAFEAGYRDVGEGVVLERLRDIEGRGRYR